MRKILVAIIAFCLLCPNLLSAQQRYKFGPEEKDYKGYLFTFLKEIMMSLSIMPSVQTVIITEF